MKTLPTFKIRDFRKFSEDPSSADAFYANTLRSHVKLHDFTNVPHKHDFFFLVLVTTGKGIHEIDFKKYPVKPGSVFFLRPGQMHNWKLSENCDGFIFFHTRDFYDEGFTLERIQDYPFYSSHHTSPLLLIKNKFFLKIKLLMAELTEEFMKQEQLKFKKIHTLVNLVYIELSRLYQPILEDGKENYQDKLKHFEALIDQHFRDAKTASAYASWMNISEKHLNRISKICLNKTSTELIAERIILEAKRMLIHSRLSVTEIAYRLGYKDKSYFNRFFKKHTHETPLTFSGKYKH